MRLNKFFTCPECGKYCWADSDFHSLCGQCQLPLQPHEIEQSDAYDAGLLTLHNNEDLFRFPEARVALIDFLSYCTLDKDDNAFAELEVEALGRRLQYLIRDWQWRTRYRFN